MPKGGYNLQIFERLVKDIPDSRTLYGLIVFLGFIYGSILTILLDQRISWQVGSGSLSELLLISVLILILPAVVSAEVYYRTLNYMQRNWALTISFIGETVFFVFMLVMRATSDVARAWEVYWAGVLTVFVISYTILVASARNSGFKRLGLFTLTHPFLLLFPMALIWQFEPFTGIDYITHFAVLVITGLILIALVILHEYLMRVNIQDINGFDLSADLVQRNEEDIEAGYPARPEVYNLEIENEDGVFSIGAPWVHPGPLGGFGGATLSKKIIDGKNVNDRQGFFLHMPTTHQSDPVSSSSINKINDAMKEAEKTGKASKLLKKEYEHLTLRGRKIGEKKIVFVETDKYDDYEKAIFSDAVEEENVLIIDQHNHREHEDLEVMHATSVAAEETRESLKDFLAELENVDTHDYSAGYAADPDEKAVMALVEEVDGERTLTVGSDENGPCENLLDMQEEYSEEFDEVNVFTTDTHKDLKDLARKEEIPKEKLREVIEDALENLGPAKIGFSISRTEEINLLHRDYYSITHSANIISRLFLLSIIIFYISLMIWLL
jgi:putative membrane protein